MNKYRTELKILVLENEFLRVEVVPDLGGKISSIYNKELNKEFLWHNEALDLEKQELGGDYDLNFWGGIDELLPNDIPEIVDQIAYPDHGELWTTVLNYSYSGDKIILSNVLGLSGLSYTKEVSLNINSPRIELKYHIKNKSKESRHFLWKLHAALRITEGDYLLSTAQKAKIVDAEYSRFTYKNDFDWPMIEGKNASVIPAEKDKMDFFYLFDTQQGRMVFLSENEKHMFTYEYDKSIFPYEWYFASYGQFRDHHVAILEPATAMPVSLLEAASLKQCSVLGSEEEINTIVNIYAGLNL